MLLGASNVVRGLHVLLGVARAAWGRELEVLTAIGLGRSYGTRSMVLGRVLPSVLESGLWAELERRPRLPTRAIVTDVGNDILYTAPVADIARWVAECVARLRGHGAEVVVTGLPIARAERLGPAGYAALKMIIFPRYRWLPRREALARAREVNEALRALAEEAHAQFFEPRDEWYGLDPIHLRLGTWRKAWGCILAGRAEGLEGRGPSLGPLTAARLAAAPPALQWLFGRERRRAQPALTIPGGMTVSMY